MSLPHLGGCAQQDCQVFKLVWLRTATWTLHDELPGGIVLCFPPGCNLPNFKNTMTVQKDECRKEVLFIPSEVTFYYADSGEKMSNSEMEKGFVNGDQQQGSVTKQNYVKMLVTQMIIIRI